MTIIINYCIQIQNSSNADEIGVKVGAFNPYLHTQTYMANLELAVSV